jgi:eukaryotic-like serine/threonine-protein kinase
MRFGQYEIEERVAVGGMAEIYRGRARGEEGFEKPVAIKRILPPFAQDQDFVNMLLTEARIHAGLSHKNIVQIHDLGVSSDGEYFIVLEYIDGRDLAAILEQISKNHELNGQSPRISDALALFIISELAEGVHFAHELCGAEGEPLGLIHRDISPSNVLMSYAGEVKLSDFGLAKRRTDHSTVGSLKGKLGYMSPEQARRSKLDRRSDIFALGAVLFELLTGHRLRDIKDEVDGWRQVASGLVPPARSFRPDLSVSLDRLLATALAADPRDRFVDARALVVAARKAAEEIPRSPSGERAELQELLHATLPPGSPRPRTEKSKVIRLVSDFLPQERPAAAAPPPERTPPGPSSRFGEAFAARNAESSNPLARYVKWMIPVLLFAAAGLYALRDRPGRPPAARSAIRVQVASEPAGAMLILDGRPLTGRTPVALELPHDQLAHALELRLDGFQSAHRQFGFDDKPVISIAVTLVPEGPSVEPLPDSTDEP